MILAGRLGLQEAPNWGYLGAITRTTSEIWQKSEFSNELLRARFGAQSKKSLWANIGL